MLIYPMHKSTYNDRKTGFWIFFVTDISGWSGWRQWGPCTNKIDGIQMRTRRCVYPKPRFGVEPCTGPNPTAMRGCGVRSRCLQGILQMLKKKFYNPTPQDFPTYLFGNFRPQCFHLFVHQALLASFIGVLMQRATVVDPRGGRKRVELNCFELF